MPLTEKIKTFNSLVRTLVMATAVGMVGFLGWVGYRTYHAGELALKEKETALAEARRELEQVGQELVQKNTRIAELGQEIVKKDERIEQLATAMTLLKVDHRLAEITVLEQGVDPESKQHFTKIKFVEVNDEGQPIDLPREFKLQGDLIYIDYWVVKFDDKYVEQADLDRSTSICLFRRIFGEHQQPRDGFVLDRVGSRPTAYARGGELSEFEKKIWDDFWNIANNPRKAHELGIRAAHGEAVSTQLRPGKTYRLELRASGGLTITPAEDSPKPEQAT